MISSMDRMPTDFTGPTCTAGGEILVLLRSQEHRRRKGEQDLQQQQMTETEPEPWLVRIDEMQVVIIESHDRKQDPGDQVL
mmetsp:Transcript_61774/g.135300  ORF Transcript_61774/g.135300 Transcript_61774/m.135300 type:complete len:81 (-) Transcript_61774:138-380(-)